MHSYYTYAIIVIASSLSITYQLAHGFQFHHHYNGLNSIGIPSSKLWKKRSNTILYTSTASSSSSSATSYHEPQSPKQEKEVDNRPHEQRRTSPRKARRLNHPFQHLYRHDTSDPRYHSSEYIESMNTLNTTEYLIQYGGYNPMELQSFSQSFPPLLELDVERHLKPKMRFLKYTLQGGNDSDVKTEKEILTLSNLGKTIPPSYYGARLEHAIAPRHAFLTYISSTTSQSQSSAPTFNNAPPIQLRVLHGKQLLHNPDKMYDFLHAAGRSSRQFAALCNRWNGSGDRPSSTSTTVSSSRSPGSSSNNNKSNGHRVISQQIEEFEQLFRRGLLSAARNEWSSQFISPAQMIPLLVQHGSNIFERDTRGVSLLHWAAGSGNLDTYQALEHIIYHSNYPYAKQTKKKDEEEEEDEDGICRVERDGATPLHWAAAGAGPKEFGIGGHLHLCQYILNQAKKSYNNNNLEGVVNAVTKDGNSILMWASWAGSLPIVQLLIEHNADIHQTNRNGCTVAHWAASGGNLSICQYLNEQCNVEFVTVQNHAGNTPLSHAVAYGRLDVVRWLKEDLDAIEVEGLDAKDLARDFVTWTSEQQQSNNDDYSFDNDDINSKDNKVAFNHKDNRKAVLDLFMD